MMERLQNILSNFLASRFAGTYILLWSFVFSILVSSFIKISPWVSILFLIIALGIYLGERIARKKVSKEIFLLLIALASVGLGSLRYAIKDFHEIQTPVKTGVVLSEPEHRDADTRFVFESDNGERALVSTDLLSPVEYGERVEISGSFKRPTSDTFDYGAYLSVQDIYWTVNYARVASIPPPALGQASARLDSQSLVDARLGKSRPAGYWLFSPLLKLKNSFVNKIKTILTEPEASLLAGLIVAGKQALPASVLNDFKNAGVIHIVVLSGYNVTIIAEFFLGLLGFLGKRRSALVSAIAIILFTLMTGATATVVRAAIMVLALLLGKIIGRPYHPGRILLFTACLMFLWNPKYLIFDPSFQLSFLAMLALVYVMPMVEKYLQKIPEKFGLRTVLATTIATQVTVLPFLLYSIGQVSIVSLFSNILILFFVPYTMLVGFAAVTLAYISVYLAWPLAFISHLLLSYILAVAHFFGNLPFASITAGLPAWGMIICYLAFTFLLTKMNFKMETAP